MHFGYIRLLELACKNGDKEGIEYLLSRKKRVKTESEHAVNYHKGEIDAHDLLLLEKGKNKEYIFKYARRGGKDVMDELYSMIDWTVKHAYENGQVDIIRDYDLNDHRNMALYGACNGGHIEIVNLLIEKGADDWDLGLRGACKGGHVEIFKLLVPKEEEHDPDNLLHNACKGGNMEIIKLIIGSGATDWDYGLWGACEGGHMEVVMLMIEKGARNWDRGLTLACYKGHMDIVKLMLRKGARAENLGCIDPAALEYLATHGMNTQNN